MKLIGHPIYLKLLDELKELHITKSRGYGNGSDPLFNFTAIGTFTGEYRFHYPCARAIEKLARCESLFAQNRLDELGEEFLDIASLMLCAEAMRREDGYQLSKEEKPRTFSYAAGSEQETRKEVCGVRSKISRKGQDDCGAEPRDLYPEGSG